MHKLTITDVRAVPGDSAFLIDDGKTAIMYDSGFAFTGYAVAENIRKLLGNRPLNYIFLTHSHYDHALGSVYAKKLYPHAKVVAGEYATQIFAKPTAKAVMRDLDKKFAKICGVTDYEDLTYELSVDIPVNDGDEVTAGDMHFTVIALPGHTRCSVGYYLPENKLLLGCETLGVYGGEGIVVPSCLIGYGITLDSIEKARSKEIRNILVPHYGMLNSGDTAKYLESCRPAVEHTANSILKTLKSGGTPEDALEFFRETYYHGYIKEIYPVDAMELNTKIMIRLIQSELGRTTP